MKLIDFILKILGLTIGAPLAKLIEVLEKAKAAAPDLAPEIDPVLAALNAPIDLAALGKSVVSELWDIVQGHINPRQHPDSGF